MTHLGIEEISNVGPPSTYEKKYYEAFILTEPTVSSFQNNVVDLTFCSIGLKPNEEELSQINYSLDVLEKRMDKILVSRLMVHSIPFLDSLQEAYY